MCAYPPQGMGTGIGTGQVKKIIETTETLVEEFKKLRKQLEKRERKDDEFKRKLEAAISQLRETDNEMADRFDKLLQGWNYL